MVEEESDNIADSLAKLALIQTSGREVILDMVKCDPLIDPLITRRDVQDLARILANLDSLRFGLLPCDGVVKYQHHGEYPASYGLLLRVPSETINHQSLRQFLAGDPSEALLHERIDIAMSLARAVLFLHAFHFVHKSIRPENVILIQRAEARLGKPHLIGFEKFRLDTTGTHRYGDDLWEKNLYRHPLRQGIHPQEDFIMQHDVYSLGVVLLELGLSINFVDRLLEPNQRPIPAAQLEISSLSYPKQASFRKANAIKERLVTLAKTKLPNTFG